MLDTEHLTESDVRRIVREEIERAFRADPSRNTATIIASKGTLDWAYPPFILATTAAAIGMRTSIFFTFYGLNLIRKDFEKRILVAPTGNPAMPMPVPMPDVLTGMPGMKAIATGMMKSMFRKKNVATLRELIDSAFDLNVNLVACQMTMEVFGYKPEDFLDGVQFGGAAAFLSEARRSHVTLFI
ncbi:MAG TPA: DsrE/DsrF/DrsH-like family protein [Longimicrobiales bacterium]|nr:DsrE/DsrF/DrsH-like family protein [Longimicrobiales bacterium]